MGRPSRLVTRTPLAKPLQQKAVAYTSGSPRTNSSGCRTYGRIGCGGCFVHAVNPASVSEAADNFRKFLRVSSSGGSAAPGGNSGGREACGTRALSGFASSLRLLQYLSFMLAVTHAAVAKLLQPFARNVVLLQQLRAPLQLISRRFPFHVEDLIFGS